MNASLKPVRRVIMAAVAVLTFAGWAFAETFPLQYDRLEPGLTTLSGADRDSVSDTINLIKKGKHVLALARLSELKEHNPNNSSLRVLAAYALLQAGNLLGAFEEAQHVHDGSNGNSYQCWFLAKVALLNGKREICERELEHVKGAGDMAAEARALEQEMASH